MIYRKARFDDIESIFGLVHIYAAQGEMLPRSRNTLYENLRDMVIAESGSEVVGVGALHIMWDRNCSRIYEARNWHGDCSLAA